MQADVLLYYSPPPPPSADDAKNAMRVHLLRLPGDPSEGGEEEKDEIKSFSDSDSDADDDFVMQPRASKGGKSSSDASKRPSESDDIDEHLLPVPKKRRTAMPK